MIIRLKPSRRQFVVGLTATVATGCAGGDKSDGPYDTDTGSDDTGDLTSVSMIIGTAHLSWAADGREFEVDPVKHTIVGREADGTELWRYEDLVEEGINFPWEVHVHDGMVFVLLRGSHLIGVFDEDGEVIGAIGDVGNEEGQLHHPADFAVGDDGRIYVSDTANHRVQVFDSDGTYVTHFGEHGVDDEHHLNGPRGLAFDAEGLLHVADRGNRRVHVYTLEGEWVRSYGQDELTSPASIAVAPDGTIFVADTHDTELHHFDADGSHLTPVAIEVDGWPAHPAHLDWTANGELYVRVTSVHHEDTGTDWNDEEGSK